MGRAEVVVPLHEQGGQREREFIANALAAERAFLHCLGQLFSRLGPSTQMRFDLKVHLTLQLITSDAALGVHHADTRIDV